MPARRVRKNIILASVGCASFVLFAIAQIPATILTSQLPPGSNAIGINGTIWKGSVAAHDVANIPLRRTSWDLHPAALLLGRLSGTIVSHPPGGRIETEASVSLLGTVRISDLSAAGSIGPLATRMRLPVSGGNYAVEAQQAIVKDAWLSSLVGGGRVTGVPLNPLAGPGGPTGSFVVTFDVASVPDDGRVAGAVDDDSGPVDVSGRIVLSPPAAYQLDAAVKAQPDAPPDIRRALALVGPVGRDGRRELSLSGSF